MTPAHTGLVLRFSEEAHIGKRKKEQQDAHGHLEVAADPASGRPACYLFVVADGVSMGQAGALASRTAVDELVKHFRKQLDQGKTDLSEVLASAFAAANYEVSKLAQTRPGMATTCVAALIAGQTLLTAHVGDSRAYLARPGAGLKPVTVDHSWTAEMGEWLLKQGHLTPQELQKDPRRHTITRAFGLAEQIDTDFNMARLEPGDSVILCSDGLWDLLPHALLEASSLDKELEPEAISHKLVEAAMQAGGRDNITLTFVRVESLGEPVTMPGLEALLERTARDLADRTRPLTPEAAALFSQATAQIQAKPPASREYQPMGVVDLPGEEAGEIEDTPSLKLPSFNPEMILSSAQKSFALGNWDEAIGHYIQLELLQASYHGLYESFSNALIRYVGVAIGEGRVDQAEQLLKRLDANQITRYHELLADYCIEESGRAAKTHHYPAARAYALFCLRLRPNDTRARTLSELSDMYLALQRPATPLSGRLAVAQKIYARDEDFGGIQDDLARIYMELGDEAVKNKVWEDAASWYSMIAPLRPSDSRLLSLALHKQRSLEDGTALQNNSNNEVTYPNLQPGGKTAALRSSERERIINEGRPEQEMLNRLKERVSRAQKAWDAGRKEVGAEYIYLVDQLNEMLSPNPWQQTLPRVCYDYAKWLLEQKQFEEARPYFQKANQLGITAAQQRLFEIDRVLRERTPGGRGLAPADLPDNPERDLAGGRTANVRNLSNLFTTRRSPLTGPLISTRPEEPDSNNYGKPAGSDDKALAGEPLITPPLPTSESSGPPPRVAAAIAAGNWDLPRLPEAVNGSNSNSPTETLPIAATGASRQPLIRQTGSPIHQAAQREGSRLAGTGYPRRSNSGRFSRWDRQDVFNLIKGVALIGVVLGVIIAAIVFIVVVVVPGIGNKMAANSTATAVVQDTATLTPATPTAPALEGVQGIVRIEGVKADNLRVFLATAGDPTSPYRELSQEGNLFRLPVATLNRLDPSQSYIVVVRPKDTADRQYADNLPPENPFQQAFTRTDLSYDPVKGFDVTMRLQPEGLAFYPLKGGTTDQDVPGGRYFAVFRHTVRGDYLKFYNANGGLARFGFPISEEFDWTGSGRVQFFERGWLAVEAPGKPVSVGKVGQALMESTCSNIPRLPANVTPVAVPTIKTDPDFASAANTLKLGNPQTQAFEVPGDPNKLKVQYFEQGRLELTPADKDKKKAPTLGLLGAEYARCIGWLK
jgi:protein phosphatase